MHRCPCATADFGHTLMQMKAQVVSAKTLDVLKTACEAMRDVTEPKGPCPHAHYLLVHQATAMLRLKRSACCKSGCIPSAPSYNDNNTSIINQQKAALASRHLVRAA